MADLVTIIDINEPMTERTKKDGSGTYKAMKVTVKMPDGGLKTIMSFDEKKIGEQVSVEEKNGFVNIVKPSRGYDKPAAVGTTDVMQALRFQYELTVKIDKKLDAIMADIGLKTVAPPTMTDAVNAALMDIPLPPTAGIDKFKQAREEHGLQSDNTPDDDDMSHPIDLSEIPF
jgi:hypothetical protein